MLLRFHPAPPLAGRREGQIGTLTVATLAPLTAALTPVCAAATMPRKVERLAADALTNPVRVTVGTVGGANEDVKQASADT